MMLAMRARPPSAALGRLVGAAMFAALAAPGVARAEGEVEACVRASDQGQQLRDEGQLSAAKAAFIRCARPACPTVVRNDCGQWLAGVNARLPTVVPALKDETGADVLDAKVSVDGKPLVASLDGKAVEVDPGPHTFRFERAGSAPVEVKVIVREGERARMVAAKLEATASAPGTEPAPRPGDEPTSPPPAGGTGGGVTWVPFAVGGLGVVALGAFAYFGFSATSEVDELKTTCGRTRTCTDDQIGSVRTKLVAADVSLGIGVVALGAATVLFLVQSGSSGGAKAASAPLLTPPRKAGRVGLGAGGLLVSF